MDLRIGTTTPAPRSITTAPTDAAAPLAERYVGDLAGPHPKDRRQPLFVGARLGATDGYANAHDAATALAATTDGEATPAAVLVQRPDGDRVDAFVLEAPVWKKSWFRTEVVGSQPAHVDGGDRGGVLGSGVVARTADGTLSGSVVKGGYGPAMGSIVGIVDDSWGRLSDEVVDLGVPFNVTPGAATPVDEPRSKQALATALEQVGEQFRTASRGIDEFAAGRETPLGRVGRAWTDVRSAAASIERITAFPGLPNTFVDALKLAGTRATGVDQRLQSQSRVTAESVAWRHDAGRGLNESANQLIQLAGDPWVVDLDKAEIGKILTKSLSTADTRIGRSIGQLLAVPKGSESDEAYLPLRKEARTLNLAAQEQLEAHFSRTKLPKGVLSALRSADASLEDATWQIVGKPSPDGRFNGLDIQGAIDSERTARTTLRKLATEYEIDLGDATEPTPDVPKPEPSPSPSPGPSPGPDPNPSPGPSPTPLPGVDPIIARNVKAALKYLATSESSLASIPNDAQEAETWLPTRKSARQDNLDAQKLLEDRFLDPKTPQNVVSTLRRADATLEDVTWQIVGKPSPDGRFKGVDIPGALRDTRDAIKLLEGLVAG